MGPGSSSHAASTERVFDRNATLILGIELKARSANPPTLQLLLGASGSTSQSRSFCSCKVRKYVKPGDPAALRDGTLRKSISAKLYHVHLQPWVHIASAHICLRMSLCVCVCMYVCMYVCTYTRTHPEHKRTHTCRKWVSTTRTRDSDTWCEREEREGGKGDSEGGRMRERERARETERERENERKEVRKEETLCE